MASRLRLILILAIAVPATILLIPLQYGAARLRRPLARRIPLLWHRMMLRLVGVRVHLHGTVPARRPLLIVSNHLSWSDILVLGSVMELCFIAKDEVKSWPGINWLARLQRTVFVNRERKRDSGNQASTIARRLVEGDAMVLFAEGTTGDGHRLLPFKSALFAAVHHALATSPVEHVTVQPVAIAYTRLHGLPLGRFHQSRASWPGDVELVPHLKQFMLDGAYDVDVTFGVPRDFSEETSRKAIAAQMHGEVRQAFVSAMRMRRLPLPVLEGTGPAA